mmetsp:Transcript_7246/g.21392  ORF Transcript_7246/g.21392 Transcript_7246/m.21392 type:complete len:5155 (-) Transcript_7246:1654-17118(-)
MDADDVQADFYELLQAMQDGECSPEEVLETATMMMREIPGSSSYIMPHMDAIAEQCDDDDALNHLAEMSAEYTGSLYDVDDGSPPEDSLGDGLETPLAGVAEGDEEALPSVVDLLDQQIKAEADKAGDEDERGKPKRNRLHDAADQGRIAVAGIEEGDVVQNHAFAAADPRLAHNMRIQEMFQAASRTNDPMAPTRADFRSSMPPQVSFHRLGTGVDERAAPQSQEGNALSEAQQGAMSEDDLLALAIAASLEEAPPPKDDAAAAGAPGEGENKEDKEGEETEDVPLFEPHHEAGVSGHVTLNPGTFVKFALDRNVVGIMPEYKPPKNRDGAMQGAPVMNMAARDPYEYESRRRVTARSASGRKEKHNGWTIAVDIRVAALPESDPIPLLSCTTDVDKPPSTSELMLEPSGAVTVFGEQPEDLRTLVQPGRWTRITARYGTTETSGGKRVLTVFINGKPSVVDIHKHDMSRPNGRFAIPDDGFILFAGRDPSAMPGIDVRYVEFSNRCLSNTEIRVSKSQSVYRQFKSAPPDDDIRRSLALQPLYKRPPPVWSELAYVCEFGDAAVEGTGLAGASGVYSSIRVVAYVAEQMWAQQQAGLEALQGQDLAVVKKSLGVLAKSAALARQYQLGMKNPNQLIGFIRKWRKTLEEQHVGHTIFVPGGFAAGQGMSPFVLVLERTSETHYRVAVVNPGMGADDYHVSSATSCPPKIQTRTTMRFDDIQREALLDDAWWMMFWRLGLSGGPTAATQFYDDLMPLLLKKPLDAAIVDGGAHIDNDMCPLRTNERANLTGYRCVREAWMYYLNSQGVGASATLNVHLNYQLQWLKLLLQDMFLINEFDESDARLVQLAPRQVTHYSTKRITTDEAPRFFDETLRQLQETTEGIEARLSDMKITNYGVSSQALSLVPSAAKPLHIQLGDSLLQHQDGIVSPCQTAERLAGAEVVAIYFSASWCPPCRQFTPALIQVYSQLRAAGKEIEVVFVSADKSEAAFAEYFGEMPWLALPFGERKVANALLDEYSVRGFPTLVLLDGSTGKLISEEGRQIVLTDPIGERFPWKSTVPGDTLAAADRHHFEFQRFLRKEDVNGLAGPHKVYPDFVPIDFLLVPERVDSLQAGVDALRWADKLCTLASEQQTRVKHAAFYKAALLQHLFTKVLPIPECWAGTECFWFKTAIPYALQLDVLLLLKRLMEHFASSSFAIRTSREFDAVKIVVSAVMVTFADVFLRKHATDIPSEVSLVFRLHGYGITLAPFDEQSETIITTMPELNIARTGVLDYWADLDISEDKTVFDWREGVTCSEATRAMLATACREMGIGYSPAMLPCFLSGEAWQLVKNFPELEFFRDICFYHKYFLCTKPNAFPPPGPYPQKMAELQWQWVAQEARWNVNAFQMNLSTVAGKHRYPSYAVASRFTSPHPAVTEDDILHIKELKDFDGALGQRDTELLLSALTVPYLRIPIVTSFFATEDRVHALKNDTLRQLLDSVVFEPGRYLPKNATAAPEFVPAKDEKRLNTPYGLLLNELSRSPEQLLASTIRLMKLALALDTGKYFESQDDIILYVYRFACRVTSFVNFILLHEESPLYRNRDMPVSEKTLSELQQGYHDLSDVLDRKFLPMLHSWIDECLARAADIQEEARQKAKYTESAEAIEAARQRNAVAAHGVFKDPTANQRQAPTRGSRYNRYTDDSFDPDYEYQFNHHRNRGSGGPTRKRKPKKEARDDYDALYEIVSDLRAHVILRLRNVRSTAFDSARFATLVPAFTFMYSRHTWNQDLLSMPEPELFETFQTCRRSVISLANKMAFKSMNGELERTVATVADSNIPDISRGWGGFKSMSTIGVVDERQQGRFGVCETTARCELNNLANPSRLRPVIDESRADLDMGVEVNLQLCALSLKSNHLQALNEPMSSDPDVTSVFGKRSLQCAVVEEALHRHWFRIIGRDHDLQYWDQDNRTDLQEFDRDYDPSELGNSEQWIAELFEPIRQSYYMPPRVPEPIPFVLPEAETDPEADVVQMFGIDPKAGGNIIEVFLCKSLKCVNIFLIESFGRRFWRKQVYASDARFSTCFLQPKWNDRQSKWPRWGRYEAGVAGLPTPAPSAVITRGATLVDNLSGTEEMYIPSRYLDGLVPTALLEKHKYWLDDNDVLRGYPDTKDEKTKVYPHVIFITINELDGKAKICKRELKDIRSEWKEAELLELSHTKTTTEEETGLYNESGARNRPRLPSRTLDRGVYDDDKEMTLMDPLYANATGKLRSAIKCLVRIESLGFMLFWKRVSTPDGQIDLVELPRLRLLLEERHGRLYSVDHADLFICSEEYLTSHTELAPLVSGLPHSLVLVNSNNEPQVLLPLDRVPRPFIMASPFTTELVIDRVSWRSLTTRYLLLPVHVSLSFIRTPTLASALYLLLLRFLNRDYEDLQRLVISVSTDTELQAEEAAILTEISSVRDDHPNAHAARLHLSLSLADAPLSVKHTISWDVPDNLYKYLCKLSHVAMRSRLTKDQERTIVEIAIDQIAKEDVIRQKLKSLSKKELQEFFNYLFNAAKQEEITHQEKTRHEKLIEEMRLEIQIKLDLDAASVPRAEVVHLIPIAHSAHRTPFQRAVLNNRQTWLLTPRGQECILELPPRATSSAWQWWCNDSSLTAGVDAWASVQMQYNTQKNISGPQLLGTASGMASMNPREDYMGTQARSGFLFIYGLLTNSIKCKVRGNDDRVTVARLMWHFYQEAHAPSLWSSIISLILANPALAYGDKLPKFKDNRKSKGHMLLGSKTEQQPICPLDNLLQQLIPVLQDLEIAGDLHRPLNPDTFTKWSDPDDAERTVTVIDFIEDDRAQRRPGMADCLRDSLKLRLPDLDVFRSKFPPEDRDHLNHVAARLSEIGDAELAAFTAAPLSVLGIENFVKEVPRRGAHTPAVTLDVPFDVSKHPDAQTVAAKRIESRLREDMKNYEEQVNEATTFVFSSDLVDEKVSLEEKIDLVNRLEQATKEVRDKDHEFVQVAFDSIRRIANIAPHAGADGTTPSALNAAVQFELERYAGLEAWISVDMAIASLVCTSALTDLLKSNPFLDAAVVNELAALTIVTLLHSIRVGQANRVMSECRKVKKLLQRKVEPAATTDHRLQVMQRVEGLAKQLTARRHYITSADNSFDPRYLVFEFTWNIMLFAKQIDMVDEFRKAVNSNGSMVRQLIMGSGKTTVISPLLCLMLADKEHLVVEAVPPALLEFSRSILRTSFSSVLPKRVYTFSFDRSTTVTAALLKKLQRARADGGVVVTTPTAVKALMLRYIENLGIIENKDTTPALNTPRKLKYFLASQKKLVEALLLFCNKGTLLCDEIDLLLHPLRSELNFPIGEKFDLDLAPLRWQFPMFLLNVLLCADSFNGGKKIDEDEVKKKVPLAAESSRLRETVMDLVAVLDQGYATKSLQKVPHLVLLDKAYYDKSIKKLMITVARCWLEHQHFETSILGGLDLEKVLANKFLAMETSAAVKGDPACEKHFKLLNLCADWLEVYLPHALSKIDRVTFGIMTAEDKTRALEYDPYMPRTRWKLAIPFVSKDVPSRSSEFAHPDVVIALTFMAYRYEGMRFEDFREVVSQLRARFSKEVGPVKDRPSNKLYEKWVVLCGAVIRGATDNESTTVGGNAAGGEAAPAAAAAELTPRERAAAAAEARAQPGGNAPLSDDVARLASGTVAVEGPPEVVALHLIKKSDDDQMWRIYKVMRKAEHVIDHYLQEIVFPTFLRYQQLKISASGQEIGGDILFKRRIGFSGTPSALLPLEMGNTLYEKGADGLMMSAMTDPDIVSTHMIRGDWSVQSVLTEIATQPYEERYSALIDTGALITGLSNLEVAEFLLEAGLEWCQGVVFLDEADRKMVLVRATMRVVEIDQCGIKPTELFALYDQIHTTGTDLPFLSTFNARAIQTLGKDMVWRDFVQGAWRMRRIQRGHTIRLMVIPEVLELICREIKKADFPGVDKLLSSDFEGLEALQAICAWLVVNSMASERIQQQQLYMQNAGNVWRKNAFRMLCQSEEVTQQELARQREAMKVLGIPQPSDVTFEQLMGNQLLTSVDAPPVPTKDALGEAEVIALYFSAHWCPPCRQFTPVLEQMYGALVESGKKFKIVFVSADQNEAGFRTYYGTMPWLAIPFAEREIKSRLGTRFGIRGIPALILLHRNGGVLTKEGRSTVLKDPFAETWWPQPVGADVDLDEPDAARDNVGFQAAIGCFHEPIDFTLEADITEGRDVAQVVSEGLDANRRFVVSREDQAAIDSILTECKQSAGKNSTITQKMEQEQVQEQEQEKEEEKEQEQEQEVEIEKYVDLQYSRDNEEPISWRFEDIIQQSPVKNLSDVNDVQAPFYQMRSFHLHKRDPIALPRYLAASSNYFNPKWTGERRLKNVVCVMEYIPDANEVRQVKTSDSLLEVQHIDFLKEFLANTGHGAAAAAPAQGGDGDLDSFDVGRTLSRGQKGAGTSVERAFRLFDLYNKGELDARFIPHVLHAALDLEGDSSVLSEMTTEFHTSEGSNTVNLSGFQNLLLSDKFREVQEGKHYVMLSLAEAETVRRIMHVLGDRIGISVRLRVLPMDFVALDSVFSAPLAETEGYQDGITRQALRYFDGELTYPEKAIGSLLRGIQASPCRRRQLFFEQIIGCRRRSERKWQSSPLAKVLTLRSEFHLLQQRGVVTRMRLAIRARGSSYYEAFQGFDAANNGVISPSELFAALEYLGVDASIDDVIDLMRTCDADGDHNLNWGEFAAMLRWNDETLEQYDEELLVSGGIKVVKVQMDELELSPKGADEIAERWKVRDQVAEAQAVMEAREKEAAEKNRKLAMEEEAYKKDLQAGIAPNPDLSVDGQVKFDFTVNKKLPRFVTQYGYVRYLRQPDKSRSLLVNEKSYLLIDLESIKRDRQPVLFPNGGGATRINQYTVMFQFRLSRLPMSQMTLLRTAAPTSAAKAHEITIDREGSLGIDGDTSPGFGTVSPAKWLWLSLTCVGGSHLMCAVDDNQFFPFGNAPCEQIDGAMALPLHHDPESPHDNIPAGGIALFGAAVEEHMPGGCELRSFEIHTSARQPQEVAAFYAEHVMLSTWECPECKQLGKWNETNCSTCDAERVSLLLKPDDEDGDTFMDKLFGRLAAMNVTASEQEILELIDRFGEDLSTIVTHVVSRKYAGDLGSPEIVEQAVNDRW